jgi:sialate O-acetylesterase
MEMPLKGNKDQPVNGSEEAINNSANPNIRLFTVNRKLSLSPMDDVSGTWRLQALKP